MSHSIQKIIINQKNFKEEIKDYLLKDLQNTKQTLNKIECVDYFITKEKEKLKRKFKKVNHKLAIEQLFFMHPKRNKIYYAWWSEENKEVNILKYGR